MFLKEKWKYPLLFCGLAVRHGMDSKRDSDNKQCSTPRGQTWRVGHTSEEREENSHSYFFQLSKYRYFPAYISWTEWSCCHNKTHYLSGKYKSAYIFCAPQKDCNTELFECQLFSSRWHTSLHILILFQCWSTKKQNEFISGSVILVCTWGKFKALCFVWLGEGAYPL